MKLRGAYTKVGQVIATRADITPKRFVDELGFLLDAVHPRPIEVRIHLSVCAGLLVLSSQVYLNALLFSFAACSIGSNAGNQ